MLVIGMGKYGTYLAQKLQDLKNDVLVIDKNQRTIEELSYRFPDALVGDCTKKEVLESLDVENFDVCFVAIDEDFQSSLEIASLLKDMGAKRIVSKASRETQEKFLKMTGATEVVYPDKDIAEKMATKYSSDGIFDYIPLSEEYSIYELAVKNAWTGKTIEELDVRKNYGVNILAVRQKDGEMVLPSPKYSFNKYDHVVVIAHKSEIVKIENKLK